MQISKPVAWEREVLARAFHFTPGISQHHLFVSAPPARDFYSLLILCTILFSCMDCQDSSALSKYCWPRSPQSPNAYLIPKCTAPPRPCDTTRHYTSRASRTLSFYLFMILSHSIPIFSLIITRAPAGVHGPPSLCTALGVVESSKRPAVQSWTATGQEYAQRRCPPSEACCSDKGYLFVITSACQRKHPALICCQAFVLAQITSTVVHPCPEIELRAPRNNRSVRRLLYV